MNLNDQTDESLNISFRGGWLEEKFIPDKRTGKKYGPYLYWRWREQGKIKSRYLGRRVARNDAP